MKCAKLSDSSCEDSETLPLLLGQMDHQHQKHNTFCGSLSNVRGLNYRFLNVKEKGATLMIVWNVFFVISLLATASNLDYGTPRQILVCSLTLLYPVVGWLADCWIGRYRILKVASYSLLISIIFKEIWRKFLKCKFQVLHYFASSTWSVAVVCYFACIFQFTMDQSVGASGEELTAPFTGFFRG